MVMVMGVGRHMGTGCSSTKYEVEPFDNSAQTRSQPPLKGGGGGGGGGGSGGGRGVAPQPAGSKASAPLSNGKEFFDMSKPTAATATTGTGSGSAIANGGGIRPDTKTANPNRGGARAMTGAAASTGHEKDSKSPSKGKRNHSLMRFNRAELMKMSRPALSKMFDHYDKDRDEKLGPIELRRLARDIMRKVAEFYGQRLRAAQPDLTDADVAEAFEKERLFLLPGDNDKETVKQLCLVLIKTIDFVHGKTVSKNVFLVQWGKAAQTVFPPQATDSASDGMACVIL